MRVLMGSAYFCFVATALSDYSSAPSDDCQDQRTCKKGETRTGKFSGLGQADWGYTPDASIRQAIGF